MYKATIMSGLKEKAGIEIAARAKDGDVIGVGTGSTVDAVLVALGERIKQEKLTLKAVPSSRESAKRCAEFGLTVLDIRTVTEIPWGFDGADAVDPDLQCIKGKGGALLGEKILAAKIKHFLIVVDSTKLFTTLAGFPIPIECIPEAEEEVINTLKRYGATSCTLRSGSGKFGATITENGNIILDAAFPSVTPTLAKNIKNIVGVVEHGLFLTEAHEVVIATAEGIQIKKRG